MILKSLFTLAILGIAKSSMEEKDDPTHIPINKNKKVEKYNTKNIRKFEECGDDELRVFTENCSCTDGYYDNLQTGNCQLCPYPLLKCDSNHPNQERCDVSIILSFDHFTTQEAIDRIDDYLVNEKKIFEQDEYQEFKANRGIHAKAIRLTNQTYSENIDFKLRRYHKHSNRYYVPNENWDDYGELVDFIKSLDIFEFVGEFSIIIQTPDQEGKIHRDHKFEDLTSEFIWFRGNRKKQFFVCDLKSREPYFVTSYLAYFDDFLPHNSYPDPFNSYSVRVTGKFKPHVRKYVAENLRFQKEFRRYALLQNEEKLVWNQDQGDCGYMKSNKNSITTYQFQNVTTIHTI